MQVLYYFFVLQPFIVPMIGGGTKIGDVIYGSPLVGVCVDSRASDDTSFPAQVRKTTMPFFYYASVSYT